MERREIDGADDDRAGQTRELLRARDVIAAFENYTAEILGHELFLATTMLVDRRPECPMVKADVLEGIGAGIMMATARYEVVAGVESV